MTSKEDSKIICWLGCSRQTLVSFTCYVSVSAVSSSYSKVAKTAHTTPVLHQAAKRQGQKLEGEQKRNTEKPTWDFFFNELAETKKAKKRLAVNLDVPLYLLNIYYPTVFWNFSHKNFLENTMSKYPKLSKQTQITRI